MAGLNPTELDRLTAVVAFELSLILAFRCNPKALLELGSLIVREGLGDWHLIAPMNIRHVITWAVDQVLQKGVCFRSPK